MYPARLFGACRPCGRAGETDDDDPDPSQTAPGRTPVAHRPELSGRRAAVNRISIRAESRKSRSTPMAVHAG